VERLLDEAQRAAECKASSNSYEDVFGPDAD